MYRVVTLPYKVLITTDEVINQGPTDADPEIRQLLQAIKIAEERFIKPAIGKELYYDIRDKKNTVVSDVNKSLLETMINESLEEAGSTEQVTLKAGEIVNALELIDNDWYVQLWNEYLWKLTAECVVYIASPTNYSRYTAQGEMVNNPRTVSIQGEGKGSETVELKDLKWKLDKLLMDRIDPLIKNMHEWLCDNVQHFPLYCKDCSRPDNNNRKTAWIHGIYNKPKRDC